MSKIAVVYWSGTGNTEAMAEAVGEGIKAAGTTDRKAVMEAVKGLKDLKVPVGVITCDENNDLVHNINVARIENKIPKFIKAVSVE